MSDDQKARRAVETANEQLDAAIAAMRDFRQTMGVCDDYSMALLTARLLVDLEYDQNQLTVLLSAALIRLEQAEQPEVSC